MNREIIAKTLVGKGKLAIQEKQVIKLEENISKHLQKSRREVITGLLIDIIKNKKAQNNNLDFVEYINNEIKNRSIKANVRYYKDKKDKLLVEYYNIKYLVEIDKVCKY